MIKNKKVKKLLDENGLEIQNFSMINRLKNIINDLYNQINDQLMIIQNLKRDSKTTKINEMQVQIQHLNDQNKRLILIIQEKKCLKSRFQNKNEQKTTSSTFKSKTSKKSSQQSHFKKQEKQDLIKQMQKQKKYQTKYYQLLNDYESLKKQVINIKVTESVSSKKRKSQNIIDKNCMILEKNAQFMQKVNQEKLDLEAQNKLIKIKLSNLEHKIQKLEIDNQQRKKLCMKLEYQLKSVRSVNQKQALKLVQVDHVKDEQHENKCNQTQENNRLQDDNRLSLKY